MLGRILPAVFAVACNYSALVAEYRNLARSPIECYHGGLPNTQYHGLCSIINNKLIGYITKFGRYPDYSRCLWAYGCRKADVLGTGGTKTSRYHHNTCTAPTDRLSAAAHVLTESFKPAAVAQYDVAVHIRSGDKMGFESRNLVGMTDNLDWWDRFIRPVAHGSLFLASDNCTLAHALSARFNNGQNVVHCEAEKGGHTGIYWDWTCKQTRAFIEDLYVMANARVFVGSLNSNVARFVVKLRRFDSGVLPVPKTNVWPPEKMYQVGA